MLEALAFYGLGALILGFGLMVITARNPVHSVVFLVLNFLAVAMVYVVLGAEFLAVIQVLVYAGGIVVLYLFVVMLVNLKRAPEVHDPHRKSGLGMGLAAAVLAELTAILIYTSSAPSAGSAAAPAALPLVTGNTEQVGLVLYTDYLIPFELASMLLLAAMVGAIFFARKAE